MTVYHRRHALRGPLTQDRIAALPLPMTRRWRRGYQVDEVEALLHPLAFELQRRTRERDDVWADNQRIKGALPAWQSEQWTYQAP